MAPDFVAPLWMIIIKGFILYTYYVVITSEWTHLRDVSFTRAS